MQSSKCLAVAVFSSLVCVAASAAHVDFSDPKRAVGREDNIKVDAQLSDDQLSSSAPVSVTYQIENLTSSAIAIADKIAAADFDPDSQTVIFSIGAEVPVGNAMPHLEVIRPGEKRVLSTGTFAHFAVPSIRTPWTAVPRFVEIRISVLRDVTAFAGVIARQAQTAVPQPFPAALFDSWVESTDSLSLNPIPIRWRTSNQAISAESNRPVVGPGSF